MKLYSGTSNKLLSQKIFNILSEKYDLSERSFNSLQIDRFADKEILPRFNESIRDEDVFFIQSTNTSDVIMETLLIADAVKRAGARSFTLVAPFQGYSRQDKTDHIRSSIGSKLLADMLETAGMTRLITIDLHASAIQGFYTNSVIHLNGNKIFSSYIKSLDLEDLCICSPDHGAISKNSNFARAFPESTFAVINKKRIKPNEIHSMELIGDVSGKNVLMIDDLIDTASTICKASEIIMNAGAKSVRAIGTHGVLSGKAIENINNSNFTEVIISDTINLYGKESNKIKVISCSDLVANSIDRLLSKKSINELNEMKV